MEIQPLRFTLQATDPARSILAPTVVNIDNWDQLRDVELTELRLTGGLDLSTATRVIGLNAWLAISCRPLPQLAQPGGSYQVDLIDESAVSITATLTSIQDVSSLAQELNKLIEPMHGVRGR